MATLKNTVLRVAIVLLVLVFAIAGTRWDFAKAQEKGSGVKSREDIEVTVRFADTLRPTNARGATVPLRAECKEWHLTRDVRGTEFPEKGFYVAHLVAGVITTVIDGKSADHVPGDFWAVERGSHMVVKMKVHRETAVIQTISVSPTH